MSTTIGLVSPGECTVVVNGILPGALASIAWSPGSTGTGVPRAPVMASMWIDRPAGGTRESSSSYAAEQFGHEIFKLLQSSAYSNRCLRAR